MFFYFIPQSWDWLVSTCCAYRAPSLSQWVSRFHILSCLLYKLYTNPSSSHSSVKYSLHYMTMLTLVSSDMAYPLLVSFYLISQHCSFRLTLLRTSLFLTLFFDIILTSLLRHQISKDSILVSSLSPIFQLSDSEPVWYNLH